jgi:syntaxin 6
MVENNRAKFPGITNPELGARKVFVDDSTFIVSEIKKSMESQAVRAKLAKDETDARMAMQRSMPTAAAAPKDQSNSDFIRNQRQQTHQIIDQQDVALTDLGASVDRLGDMGRTINEELREQNAMLDELDDDLDDAGNKMNFVMAKLAKLLKTKDGCLLWTIFILTALLAILVALTIWT